MCFCIGVPCTLTDMYYSGDYLSLKVRDLFALPDLGTTFLTCRARRLWENELPCASPKD